MHMHAHVHVARCTRIQPRNHIHREKKWKGQCKAWNWDEGLWDGIKAHCVGITERSRSPGSQDKAFSVFGPSCMGQVYAKCPIIG